MDELDGLVDGAGRPIARAVRYEGNVWWAVQLRGPKIAAGVIPPLSSGAPRAVAGFLRGQVNARWGRGAAAVTLTDDDVGLADWSPADMAEPDEAAPSLRVQQVVDHAGEIVAEVRPVDGDAVVVAPDGTEVARHVGGARSAAALREVVRRAAPPPPAARVQVRVVRG